MAALFCVAQDILTVLIRPYIIRELPGWGKIYSLFIGDYRRNWFWENASRKIIYGKLHGYKMHLDISRWSDRITYFLGRWIDLPIQLLLIDLVSHGNTIIDVGANRGNFSLLASHLVGNTGKVICFEPNPECFNILKHEIDSNHISNVSLNNIGLSDKEDSLLLSVPLINSGEGTFGSSIYGGDNTFKVKADVCVGDSLLLQEENIDIIKIDVEGFEVKAISGLKKTLLKYHPIIITEVIEKHLEACGSSVSELKQLLEGFEYIGFALEPRRQCGKYTWQLSKFQSQQKAENVVWLHPLSIKRHPEIFNKHIVNCHMPL